MHLLWREREKGEEEEGLASCFRAHYGNRWALLS